LKEFWDTNKTTGTKIKPVKRDPANKVSDEALEISVTANEACGNDG
jgi:hypothetical protein